MSGGKDITFSLNKVDKNIIGSLPVVPQNVSYLAVDPNVEFKATGIDFFGIQQYNIYR